MAVGVLTGDGLHGGCELPQGEMQQLKMTVADERGLVGVMGDTGKRADSRRGGEAGPVTSRGGGERETGGGVHIKRRVSAALVCFSNVWQDYRMKSNKSTTNLTFYFEPRFFAHLTMCMRGGLWTKVESFWQFNQWTRTK